MIQARIEHGRIEPVEPIPDSWEGQWVGVEPLTPDAALPDIEQRLAALHALGAMEFEAGEQDRIGRELAELDRLSREAMQQIPSRQP